jgi:hypothetical protein
LVLPAESLEGGEAEFEEIEAGKQLRSTEIWTSIDGKRGLEVGVAAGEDRGTNADLRPCEIALFGAASF